jgi:hypothetical protein
MQEVASTLERMETDSERDRDETTEKGCPERGGRMGRGSCVSCVVSGLECRRTRGTGAGHERDSGWADDDFRSVSSEEHRPSRSLQRQRPAGESSRAYQSECAPPDSCTGPVARAQSLSAWVGRADNGRIVVGVRQEQEASGGIAGGKGVGSEFTRWQGVSTQTRMAAQGGTDGQRWWIDGVCACGLHSLLRSRRTG